MARDYRRKPAQQRSGAGTSPITMREQFLTSRAERYFLYKNEEMTAPCNRYLQQGFAETHRATQDVFDRTFMKTKLAGGTLAIEVPR